MPSQDEVNSLIVFFYTAVIKLINILLISFIFVCSLGKQVQTESLSLVSQTF